MPIVTGVVCPCGQREIPCSCGRLEEGHQPTVYNLRCGCTSWQEYRYRHFNPECWDDEQYCYTDRETHNVNCSEQRAREQRQELIGLSAYLVHLLDLRIENDADARGTPAPDGVVPHRNRGTMPVRS